MSPFLSHRTQGQRRVPVLACVVLLAFAGQGHEGQSQVGPASRSVLGDFQEAVYGMQDGGVLFADLYSPRLKTGIRVDRPLTIVGGAFYGAAIELDGTGNGVVTLIGLTILDERRAAPYSAGPARPGVYGRGFQEVRILDSWIEGTNASGSYWASVSSGVSLSVPKLVVVDSAIYASQEASQFPDYTCYSVKGGGGSAVFNQMGSSEEATVFVSDSYLAGGPGIQYCFDLSGACGSEPYQTDSGGAGVTTDRLVYFNTRMVGGRGCSWTNWPDVGPTGAPFEAEIAIELDEPAGLISRRP